MLSFLKAPANAPLITDKHEVDARYRYWRRHILITIWLGYALFYFTRKSFNAAAPEILASGILSRSDIGLLATLFYITYGVSKFVSGIVSDRSNARYFMGIGLIATGVVNILFGFSTSLWAFALLWALNAFFQGFGSPVCARLLTAWYSRTERGGWWALWNTAHNVGGALIPLVMAAVALHYGWRVGMMVAGLLAIGVGMVLCWRLRDRPQAIGLPPVGDWRLRDRPQAIGLPPVGDWRHDALEVAQQQEGAGLSRKEILAKYVLLNPYIWLLSLCYVLVYVVRAAINDWGNLYMSETLGVDLVTANTAVSMFELGGFIGALVAGWGSDKLFNGNRGPMNLIFAAGILLSVGSLWLMPFASYVMQAACFFTTGFFVFGPQMLIGMAAAECSHKEAAGAVTGFVGLFAYLGASLSGWPLAKVLEIWHWTGFFAVIAIAAGISALLLLPFLNAQAPCETSEA
ncbi:MFS transporter [Salmonella enterica]|nr:MFS transporter [Salmonella enterica]EGH9480765.1 MFS transporter [Salmonella enterica]